MAGLLDFLQGASNSAASNVSAPVDGIAWLLRKAGLPVPDAPMGGSDWMAQKGLTREPQSRNMGLLGEAIGGIAPIVAAAKAPQIAKGLLQMGENAAIPQTLSKEAGVIKAGEPFTFIRNTQKSPYLGETYGQHIEPQGRYFLEDTANVASKLPDGWISGQHTFKNPKFIEFGPNDYADPQNWKNVISKEFGGKKGAALSKAITKAGHDGIVTMSKGETSEIIDLSRFIK